MTSPEEFRAEARRVQQAVKTARDPQIKRELALRALQLAERAEALERVQGQSELARQNIARYRSMLTDGIDDENHRQHVRDMLGDMQASLARSPMSDTDRFVSERNIRRFAHRLYSERDGMQHQTLQRLPIDEEHRYGVRSWHLDLADQQIAEGEARIAAQRKVVDGLHDQGADINLAKSFLENHTRL